MKRFFITCMLSLFWFYPTQAETASTGDYGICAHLQRWEYPVYRQELDIIKELGIGFVRFDFDWAMIEPRRGEFHFERYDELVETARQKDVEVLPILCGWFDNRRISAPYKHMDEFLTYVRACVERYKGRIRYWEVMNEVNLPLFWGDKADGAKYADLLARTSRLIREIDPSAVVVYSGLSGIPLDFLEASFKNGAAENYDVMNIHPYSWTEVPELNLPSRLAGLHKLQEKYGVDKRDLWVTEMGNATGSNQVTAFDRIVERGIELCGIVPEENELVVIADDDYGYYSDDEMLLLQKRFKSIRTIALADLNRLDPVKNPFVMFSAVESFPGSQINKVQSYVKKGGTILLCGGLPFYFDLVPDGDSFRSVQVNDKYLKQLRIGWSAWWTDKDMPRRYSSVFLADRGESYTISGIARGISGRNLTKDDRLIPLAFGVEKDRYFPCAGVYKLGGDFKGNVILCTAQELNTKENCSEDMQAKLLIRNGLILKGHGVNKYFVFKLPCKEESSHREQHFGIVRRNLEPKPAYYAYKTLIEMCPDGSSKVRLRQSDRIYIASWLTPDKLPVHAVWTYQRSAIPVKLQFKGKVTKVVNYLGKESSVTSPDITISDAPLFIAGPEKLEILRTDK